MLQCSRDPLEDIASNKAAPFTERLERNDLLGPCRGRVFMDTLLNDAVILPTSGRHSMFFWAHFFS